MYSFINTYLQNLSQAITEARHQPHDKFSQTTLPESAIYAQLASPEFHLYEEIILAEELPTTSIDYAIA